jgi:hypothetical protein
MALRATKGDENLARAHFFDSVLMQGSAATTQELGARFSTVAHEAIPTYKRS